MEDQSATGTELQPAPHSSVRSWPWVEHNVGYSECLNSLPDNNPDDGFASNITYGMSASSAALVDSWPELLQPQRASQKSEQLVKTTTPPIKKQRRTLNDDDRRQICLYHEANRLKHAVLGGMLGPLTIN